MAAAPPAAAAAEASEDAPLAFEALHASEGFCEIVHLSSDGSSMLSAGWDGKLAATNNVGGQPPSKVWMARIAGKGGMLTAAAVSADAMWLAFSQEYENGFGVWVCPLDGKKGPSIEKMKLVARFTLPVRHLTWHPSRPILGIASNDGKLLTWDRSTSKRREFPTGSAGGSVHCVAFDPQGELLATALASGALVVFSLEDGSEKYRGNAWKKNIMSAGERFLMAWRPDGSMLALPGATAVRLVARGSYATTDMHLELGGHRYATSMAAWSPDGSSLATASIEAVALWRPPHLVRVCRVTAAPHSLLWGGTALAIGSISGSWAHVTMPSPAGEAAAKPAETTATTQESPEAAETPRAPSQPAVATEESAQAQTQEPAPAKPAPLIQAAFQPGATKDARRRYLAFNAHGALKLLLSEQSGRVEVEYNQLRFRSAVREIRAPDGLVMGALGPGVCALASASKSGQPAKVVVHFSTNTGKVRMGSKANSSHMEHVMPVGEEVEGLAVGKNFVALLSSKSNLRVQATTGGEVDTVSLTGTPVCLAASEDMLICILKRTCARAPDIFAEPEEDASKEALGENATSDSSSSDLQLEYVLYSLTAKQQLAMGRLPLSAGATLRWCSFSTESLPLALDSAGVLWALSLNRSTENPLQVLAAEWQASAELDDAGKRLWPVRAEGQSLFCVEISKGSTEPRVGAVPKLHAIRFRRTGPARAAAAQEGEAECRQALIDFEACAKTGEVEDALDVILDFFDSHTSHRGRLLKAAHQMAEELGQNELVERLTAILRVTSGAPPAPEETQLPEEAAPEAEEQPEDMDISPAEQDTGRKEEGQKPSNDANSEDSSSSSSSDDAADNPGEKPNGTDPEVARRIAENRARALERKAAAEAAKAGEKRARSPSLDKAACTPPPSTAAPPAVSPPASAGVDPEVARRIAENRAKALERKAAMEAAKAGQKRPLSEEDACGEKDLHEAPSAVRLRSC